MEQAAEKVAALAEAEAMFRRWSESADVATLRKVAVSLRASCELRDFRMILGSKAGRRMCRPLGEQA